MIQGALVHLLGSRSGYTTLGQSSALPVVVRSALEHLDFGSLSREQDIASLESVPMALGQCVAGSWVVVSRVLPGGRDDVGRLTIEKVSIVVPLQEWRSNLQDVRTLVNDRALWNRARMSSLTGGTINLETAPLRQLALQPALAVVLDRWFKAVEASGCVVLRAQDEAIFKVLQSISPEDAASLAWGVGLHGVPAFASICSILPTVSASSTRQVFEIQPTERDLRSRQAGALASCVKSAGVLQPFAALRLPEPIVVTPPRGPEPMFPMEDLRPIRGVHPARPEVWRQEPSADGRLGTRAWGIATLSLGALCLAVALFWTPSRPLQLDTGGAGSTGGGQGGGDGAGSAGGGQGGGDGAGSTGGGQGGGDGAGSTGGGQGGGDGAGSTGGGQGGGDGAGSTGGGQGGGDGAGSTGGGQGGGDGAGSTGGGQGGGDGAGSTGGGQGGGDGAGSTGGGQGGGDGAGSTGGGQGGGDGAGSTGGGQGGGDGAGSTGGGQGGGDGAGSTGGGQGGGDVAGGTEGDTKSNPIPKPACDCEKPSALEKSDVDKDKDRLSDAREKEYGSDLNKADEDQDNLSDWFEWACGTDPKRPDSDGDGVCDCKEFTQSTSPIWRDTDRDGLSDAEELDKKGLKPGKVMGEDGKRLQDKKSGQPFKYQVVTGELVPEDSRDSDGDGILDGGDIHPFDPKVGAWTDTSKPQDPNTTLRALFEALDKAMKDPAPDSKDPKKTDRQKFDGVLKALEAAVGSHDFLQTLVPGAQQRRADWLANIKADPSVVEIFNRANLREGIASVIRSVKGGSPSPLERRVYDAWNECRNEANTWAPTPTYRPPSGTLAETEPMPHFVESFQQTKCVDPGWVAVKCGALPTELKQVVAMVVLLEWLEGVNAPRDAIVVGGAATRKLEHDKPSLNLFERELDYLSHGPLPGRDSGQDGLKNKKTGGKK